MINALDRLPVDDECRWRLLVVESKRDGSGGVPREHVLVDLGMVAETVLNPNWVPGQLACEYRNSLQWCQSGRVARKRLRVPDLTPLHGRRL
jgi:hypothetical protein